MLPLQGAPVPSLVGDLRSRIVRRAAKKKKRVGSGLDTHSLTGNLRKMVGSLPQGCVLAHHLLWSLVEDILCSFSPRPLWHFWSPRAQPLDLVCP